ncbi:MAG: EAL domain-containing protein [Sulfuricurvum sp.]|uniref:EAL and HDOD domain-containing protein n=1 Tax=Sulfuricurvum sp. TaxID=2025608 RepID=UPI0025E2BC9F|nr:EAL domain-containing protein [Sulfuricurvum sp.]MBV5320398.1 EAL domain-containing protein [Sulfuricurvum sp.]
MIESDIFIGRQPIFDSKGKCISYELLYRSTHESSEAIFSSNAKATARVIINLIHNIGLSSIIGNKLGYINIDEQIIMSDVFLSLPKSKFVFEILEYTKVTPEVIDKVCHLYELGYRFALDDFSCENENIEYFKLLFPYVDVIKIDLLATNPISIEAMVEKFKPYNVKLLAEKVENIEIFERCKKAGFDYFQGFFFEKPTIIIGTKIEPSIINAIDVINTLYTTTDMSIICDKFSSYPELTFNLLRYINSAEFSFKQEITSIKQILNLLGPSRLRSWLGLFLYSGTNEQMFKEAIVNTAKFRANMMRELVMALGKSHLSDEAFLTGSLSLIDTYLHIDMSNVIEKIHLSQPIIDALLQRDGYYGKLLSITEKLEKTDDIHLLINKLTKKINLSSEQLYKIYCNAHVYSLKTETN